MHIKRNRVLIRQEQEKGKRNKNSLFRIGMTTGFEDKSRKISKQRTFQIETQDGNLIITTHAMKRQARTIYFLCKVGLAGNPR